MVETSTRNGGAPGASTAGLVEPAGPVPLATFEHWAYQVDSPLRPVQEIVELAGSPAAPPAAQEKLAWTGTAEQVAFREAVLAAHLARSRARRGPPGRDLGRSELGPVAGTTVTMRRDAAEAATRLLLAAREALAAGQRSGDRDALQTRGIGATSGYRDSAHQARLWQRYFPDYYRRTAGRRAGLAGGPHADAAVQYMITGFGLPKWIAAPGYSNHQSGIAIDLRQDRIGSPIRNSSRPAARAAWRLTWLYRWLTGNAASFGFRPYRREPWHWEYKPGEQPRLAADPEAYEELPEAEAPPDSGTLDQGASSLEYGAEPGYAAEALAMDEASDEEPEADVETQDVVLADRMDGPPGVGEWETDLAAEITWDLAADLVQEPPSSEPTLTWFADSTAEADEVAGMEILQGTAKAPLRRGPAGEDPATHLELLGEAEGLFDAAIRAYRRGMQVLAQAASGATALPSFRLLWGNHPANDATPDITPCRDRSGVSNFANQCVIRLGICFARSGISLDSYSGAFCWFGHGRTHPLRVEEMKMWLNTSAAGFAGRAEISRMSGGRQKTHSDYAGRLGLVAFIDFYGRGNQGDHIDLWNGSRLAHGTNEYFERSREIWFWPLAA